MKNICERTGGELFHISIIQHNYMLIQLYLYYLHYIKATFLHIFILVCSAIRVEI